MRLHRMQSVLIGCFSADFERLSRTAPKVHGRHRVGHSTSSTIAAAVLGTVRVPWWVSGAQEPST